MILQTHVPRPPLDQFVAFLWLQEGPVPAHGKERVLPTGTAELIIALGPRDLRLFEGEKRDRPRGFGPALICGTHSEYFVIDSAQTSAVIGAHFKPGGAFPFLGMPATEVGEQHVRLDDLWGSLALQLHERLGAAATAAAKFAVLEAALLARVPGGIERHPAVSFALRQFERAEVRTIREVTDRIGLSSRRFIQLFGDEVGLTPKRYCRVQRFQDALRLVHPASEVDWVDVALACGYYDQAHFIHDFRAFTGLSPTAYFALRGEQMNHVPLQEK